MAPSKTNRHSNVVAVLLLLLLLLLLVFPGIALSQSIVDSLPGYPGSLPFKLETGYIGVGELDEIQLFYYFVESERKPESDPLVVWLNEELGCAAFSSFLYDIGPLSFNYSNLDGPTLEVNHNSWSKVANLLFIDFPVGVGFSYSTLPESYETSDTSATANAHRFLLKWLLKHPKFLKNKLYVGGNSYAGITVPLLVQEIINGNDLQLDPKVNIKGYILGNPYLSEANLISSRFTYAQRVSLISDKMYTSVKAQCDGDYINVAPNNTLCLMALRGIHDCLELLYFPQILEPTCSDPVQKWDVTRWHQPSLPNPVESIIRLPYQEIELWCRDDYYGLSYLYMNRNETRAALHVREGTVDEWVRCNLSLSYTKNINDSFYLHDSFVNKSLRVLIYSGDQDLVVPYIGTVWWIKDLGVPVTSTWRPWFFEGQVVGYTTKYSRIPYSLTFTTVKGAGHTAPEYKPKVALQMLLKWLASYPL